MIQTESLARLDYVRNILEQPSALEHTIEALKAVPEPREFATGLSGGRYKRVVLTGEGASYSALYPLHLRLTGCGFTSLLVETAELIHEMPSLLAEGSLPVVVSQSGRSVEILRLLEMIDNRLPVIGVTNTPSSPLAERSSFPVLTRAGEEFSVSCKTYVAALAALEWLGAVLSRAGTAVLMDDLRHTAQGMRKYLANWESHVESAKLVLTGMNHIFLTGRGRSLAAARTGGLTLKESTHFPAEGMSSPAFRHGPLDMVRPGVLVCIFAGDAPTAPLNRRLAADVSSAGGTVAWIGEDADAAVFRVDAASSETRSIMEILPVQIISLALAAASGHEAGVFARIPKVTSVE
jgi:glucosamine--fructose-6-phosphate aminotransferase (isomerizing)